MWPLLLVGGGALLAFAVFAGTASASTRRRDEADPDVGPAPGEPPDVEHEPEMEPQEIVLMPPSKSATPPSPPATSTSTGAQVKLRSPLKGAPRKITPHGAFNAPRYLTSGGGTTGTPPKPGAPVHHRHQGIDLVTKPAEEIFPVSPGVVVPTAAGFGGLVVKLKLDDGRYAVYADLSKILATAGKRLGVDDPVGLASKRGFVHLALRQSEFGPYIDPTGVVPHA